MYLNSIQIIGFVGQDPERRQVKGNGASCTVLSVATQRSWKDTRDEWHSKTEWHRVVAWNDLGERIAASLRKGDHVLVEGTLVSSTYEREVRKGKKNAKVKQVSWSIRADAVRRLNRADKEPEAIASGSSHADVLERQEHTENAPL
jgi:single-strand DNA-binding protein